MFGSGVLDTIIGTCFVFLLVSILVTIANELVAAALLSRAKWLRLGIVSLIESDWAERFYAHPLIAGSAPAGRGNPGPSYVPSRAFANVLLDLVRAHGGTIQNAQSTLQATLDSTPAATVEQLKAGVLASTAALQATSQNGLAVYADLKRVLDAAPATASLGAEELRKVAARIIDPALQSFKVTVLELAARAEQGAASNDLAAALRSAAEVLPYSAAVDALKQDVDRLLQRMLSTATLVDAIAQVQRFIDAMPARYLRQVLTQLPNETVRQTLLVLLDDAEGNFDKFKENIEVWFNNAMDRVGGWYKRKSQWIIALLSIGAAVLVNVDTILIVKYLGSNPGVRDALVSEATAYVQSAPMGASAPVFASDASGLAPLRAVHDELKQLSLPIGWVLAPSPAASENYQIIPVGDYGTRFGATVEFHFLGWLLTALAATLGAPFWFDLLNRFMSIRSAGKAPEDRPKPPRDVPVPLEPGQSPREADNALGGDGRST